MKDFAEYVVVKRRAEEKKKREERAPSETAEDRKNCCVCYCQPAACAFVPRVSNIVRRASAPSPLRLARRASRQLKPCASAL